jgi:(1->4)-alpha-D-glucan 1-alpha-D-glucosylmutase
VGQAVLPLGTAERRHLSRGGGRPAPDRNDEYLLYQTLVGAWPLLAPGPDDAAAFVSRIQQYMEKATKEAKLNTSWINPNEAYDEALKTFVAGSSPRDPATGS